MALRKRSAKASPSLVEAASKQAVADNKGLREVLTKDPNVTAHLSVERIANCSNRWPIRASRKP